MNPTLDRPEVADALSQDDPTISLENLKRLRHDMDLSRNDFARLVGLSERSVAAWESGAELKESSLRTIVEIGRLYTKLRHSFASPEQLTAWLKSPNKGFGGSQPIQAIERGEIDRIWRMVYFLESGSPS